MAAIVSTARVLELTGVTVTDAHILQAQAIVGMKCGRDFDAADWAASVPFGRDRVNLAKAVAFQAAFIWAHPDVFTAADVRASSADGTSATYSETGIVLAPLAKMSLRSLSWKGTRTVTATAGRRL